MLFRSVSGWLKITKCVGRHTTFRSISIISISFRQYCAIIVNQSRLEHRCHGIVFRRNSLSPSLQNPLIVVMPSSLYAFVVLSTSFLPRNSIVVTTCTVGLRSLFYHREVTLASDGLNKAGQSVRQCMAAYSRIT